MASIERITYPLFPRTLTLKDLQGHLLAKAGGGGMGNGLTCRDRVWSGRPGAVHLSSGHQPGPKTFQLSHLRQMPLNFCIRSKIPKKVKISDRMPFKCHQK